MEKIKFAIIGSGWRSKFYIRIAKANPDLFEITSMLFRNEEKAEMFKNEYGINTTISQDVLINGNPDFVVIAVNKANIFSVTKSFLELGIPVLAETPVAISIDQLNKLWIMQNNLGYKVQVAEQYHLYPYYENLLKEINKLGILDSVNISTIHDYHAASIFKRVLGISFENFSIFGKSYNFNITETDSRDGKITDGRVSTKSKNNITLEFENGKTVFYNFSGVQYHSDIRSKNIVIQGSKGEINNNKIRYVNFKNEIINETLTFTPEPQQLDDEKAIKKCLIGMKNYIKTGVEFYPLSEALQDSYISILMHKAIQTGQILQSESQIWIKS